MVWLEDLVWGWSNARGYDISIVKDLIPYSVHYIILK